MLVRLEADEQPDEEQRRACGPGLGTARGWILDRKERPLAGVAGEGFRQAVIEELGCLEHRKRDLSGLCVESVARKPGCNQRVVVGPNGSDVIADRVVAALAVGHRAHAPAREESCTREMAGDALCLVLVDDAAPE